jgi:hypothetical protein
MGIFSTSVRLRVCRTWYRLPSSENAVKTQIWIAVSVYVLVAIVRKRLGLQVELFFKWIKRHLRIKASYGTCQRFL